MDRDILAGRLKDYFMIDIVGDIYENTEKLGELLKKGVMQKEVEPIPNRREEKKGYLVV